MSDDWDRIETREQLDAMIETHKHEAMSRLHTAALRMACEMGSPNISAAAGAIVAKAWPVIEKKMDEEAAKIRARIAPSLAVVPDAPDKQSVQ